MKYLFSFFLCFTPFLTFAQFTVGMQAGLNISTVATNEVSEFNLDLDDTYKSKVGYKVGLLAAYHAGEKLEIQSGLLYSLKGYLDDQTDGVDRLETNNNLHYLVVPVTLQRQIIRPLWLQGGIEAGYLVASNSKSKFNDIKVEDPNDKDLWKKLDLALKAGLTWKVSDKIQLNADYQWGILNINQVVFTDINGDPIEGDNPRSTNRVFSASLSYNLFGS
ncbi:MAG: hypothetical protein DHS20C18_12030 [Saprospiraceae bacterium]|nr:MAG: hypothetical protein DHS20C18_12030 [Saprospiraceae bacterium]